MWSFGGLMNHFLEVFFAFVDGIYPLCLPLPFQAFIFKDSAQS
jgi:hypothetical protein